MTRLGIFSTTALAGLTCFALCPASAQPTTTGDLQNQQSTQTKSQTPAQSDTSGVTSPDTTTYDRTSTKTNTTNTTTDQTNTTTGSTDTSNDMSARRDRLPRTASNTPTMALLGLAAIGGALALRKRTGAA